MGSEIIVHLIGVHYARANSKMPSGFSFIGTPVNKIINFSDYAKVKSILASDPNSIQGLCLDESGEIKGSNGELSRYTKIVNGKVTGKEATVILGTIGDVGYEVFAPNGKVKILKTSDVITLAKSYGLANGKLVTSADGKEFISSIRGEYLTSSKEAEVLRQLNVQTPVKKVENTQPLPKETVSKPVQSVQPVQPVQPVAKATKPVINVKPAQSSTVKQPEIKKDNKPKTKTIFDQIREAQELAKENNVVNPTRSTVVNSKGVGRENSRSKTVKVDSKGVVFLDPKNEHNEAMSVEQMLTISMMQMKKIKPFFFAALKVIPRIEANDIPTMAVSIDKMFYNPDFVISMSIPELNFVTLHEISHIMMKHHCRGEGKEPELWNVATDLYINAAICKEFGCGPGLGEVIPDKNEPKVKIKFKEGGLYNAKVDVDKDTPELIYTELMHDYTKKKQQQQQQPQHQQSGSPGQQGSGSQSGNQQGNQSGNQQGSQGQSGSQQGSGNQPGNQQGNQPGQSGNQQGNQQGQSGSSSGSGSQQGNQQGQSGGSSVNISGSQSSQANGQNGQAGGQPGNKPQPIVADFRGTQVSIVEGSKDLVKDTDSANNSSATNEQRADGVLSKVATVYKQVLESSNTMGRGKGNCGVVEAFVEAELVPKVNWRSLVQNRLVAHKIEEKSLSSPDRRFIQSGLYIEGDVRDEDKLEGIKLCIDTSGSMSDYDIAIAIHQIMQLCKMYNTQADLVYWDDGIQDIVPFDKLEAVDLKHYRAMGRGGTNPNCIFEEFSHRDYQYGKKVKPTLIIIFTDGFFPAVDSKYKTKFGKDTVWVLCSTNSMPIDQFKPTFGRVATFKSIK